MPTKRRVHIKVHIYSEKRQKFDKYSQLILLFGIFMWPSQNVYMNFVCNINDDPCTTWDLAN